MPEMAVRGSRLYYEESGTGEQTILFMHGLLMSCRMFDRQIAALSDRYRCLAYDLRGQGKSEVAKDGYTMDELYLDACELIEKLNAAPCHLVGFSMGGFIALRIAARRPELLRSLILIDTSADTESLANRIKYSALLFLNNHVSRQLATDQAMAVLMGHRYLHDPQNAEEKVYWRDSVLAMEKAGISRAAKGVIERLPVVDELGKISTPTLILAGDADEAIDQRSATKLQSAIAGAHFEQIANCGHTAPLEASEEVTRAIEAFLSEAGS